MRFAPIGGGSYHPSLLALLLEDQAVSFQAPVGVGTGDSLILNWSPFRGSLGASLRFLCWIGCVLFITVC